MKLTISLLTSFLFLIWQQLPTVREQYTSASGTTEKAEAFHLLMSNYTKEDKVLLAYKGASLTLKAKFAKTIKEKKSFFKEGAKLVEASVKSEPNNLEIRFIRLSIQENTPWIVNYRQNIDEDKKLLLSNLEAQNQSLKEYLKNYIRQSNAFTDKEKKSVLN